MNKEIQAILLRRKSKIVFEFDMSIIDTKDKTGMIGAVIANLAKLGYVFDDKLITKLTFALATEIENFYKEVLPLVKDQIGYVTYKPMYPNFPSQVANASDEELWINAIMHYFGDAIGERIMPKYDKEKRFPFCELSNAKFIGLATQTDVDDMWIQIFESKASPSSQDKADIKTFFEFCDSPISIPSFSNKEKMAYALSYILKESGEKTFKLWSKDNVKTATDVLRIAVAYSGGDESLTKNTKFGKFSRPVRRLLLDILDHLNQDNVMEDMKRHEGMWIRLGEKLHPSEYEKNFSAIAFSFHQLRNDGIETTNSKIEKFLASSDWTSLLAILKTRPGDFARRLNAIFTKADNKFVIMEGFKSVANKVSTTVLWQLYGYFKGRDELCGFRNRLFLPKTPIALVAENNLQKIDKGYQVGMVQIIQDALTTHYFNNSEVMDDMKVWIDPICKNLLIPSGNRSASTALRQVGRGSRFQIGKDKSTVRLFVYWKDIKGGNGSDDSPNRVDLDLSAVMYNKNWEFIGHCSWTNLRHGSGKGAGMVHSGDITSAPNGASEFIDINLDKLDTYCAYIACNVFCYTGQKMNQLDVGFMGWMEREYAGSGEIYEPKSVEGRCDLTADATSTCPMILDVENREIIWADLAVSLQGYCQSTETTMNKSVATAELVSRMSASRPTLNDLFSLNVSARNATIVEERSEANYVIAEDGDVSPFDVAKIMSEFI